MDDLSYTIDGVFYTDDGKRLKGVASLDVNYLWGVYDSNGNVIAHGFWNLYLDKDRKIPAPKNQKDKGYWSDILLDKIKDAEKKIEKLKSQLDYAKASPSYKMELKFAQIKLKEFKHLYTKYFQSNALKFILDDWINED
jgi:hypothetical protein